MRWNITRPYWEFIQHKTPLRNNARQSILFLLDPFERLQYFNRNGGTNKSDDVDIGKMAAQFSKRLMSSLSFGLPLGLPNEFDNMELDEVPPGFTPPTKLAHLCVDNVLPIGFRRLRRAMLSSQAYFIINELQKKKLKYAEWVVW